MKTKICIIIVLLIALTCVISSCGTVSVLAQVAGATGLIDQNIANAISNSADAIGTAAEDITPEQEYFIGRSVAATILTSYKIYNGNQALTSYLNLICAAIVVHSPRPDVFNGYHVAILDTDEINAFAPPGGHIFVTRGLIRAAQNEDALAAVIAHEIAHIQLQHSLKAIKSSRVTQAILVTGTSAVGAAAGMDVNELTSAFDETIGSIIQTMVTSGYSQSQEFEADNTAMELLAGAGYRPSGLLEMLNVLSTIQVANSGFGKTHPSPAQRITNAQKSVGKYNVPDTSSSRQTRFNTATR